jgi:HEAT repeat protein
VDYQEAIGVKMIFRIFLFSFFALLVKLNAQVPISLNEVTANADSDVGDKNTTIAIATPARSSEEKTIERAQEGLKSTEVGSRVGAAKLLGKYRSIKTSILLISALDDESPLVRRAAMVSIAEHASNGFPVYDKALAEKIYSKLGDSDVEVRREVSTMIPRIISPMRRSGMELIEINGRKVYRSVSSAMRSDLYKMTQDAFLDKDAIVRQNVLKYHTYLSVPLPLLSLEKLLSDSDLGVLLTALDRISSSASQPRIVNRVKALSKHANKGIRLKVVAVARNANSYHSDYRGILREMTNDSDPEVLSMAAVELARFGERVPGEVVGKIKNFLLGVNGLSTQVTTILYTVSSLGVDGAEIYKALTEHSSSQIRAIAWQRFINLSEGWRDSSVWLPATKDPDPKVRKVVLNGLRGQSNNLSEKQLGVLVESAFSDVRIFAAQSLLDASQSTVESLGFDLLIDEDTIVRSTTIRAMSARRVPGWLTIMKRSLLDTDYVIQRSAMDGLLGDRKEGVPVLIDYISKNPQSRISNLAKIELNKIGVQP